VSTDETTDASVKGVANVGIGVLKKRSKTIREIISSVMQGNVCSESQKYHYEAIYTLCPETYVQMGFQRSRV
jgi:hypothetical protein